MVFRIIARGFSLITDGAPTDEWQAAANKVFQGEEDKKFAFFSIGVQGGG